jgi:N-acetylneuraminate synthase
MTYSQPCFVAEISGNHLGELEIAQNLVRKAKTVGADYVKLQTYTADTITLNIDSPEFRLNANHPLWGGRTLYSLYEEAHTPWEWHKELFDLAHTLGIGIFSSPFDFSAVDFLEDLNTPLYKIASLETGDIPLIRYIAQTGKPIIASTGASTLEEIDLMVETILKFNSNELTLLLCTSSYPAKPQDAHLNRLRLLQERYGVSVGLSDHTLGNTTAVAAIALGATVIEKHLCLDRALGGPDADFSSTPDEFKLLVDACEETFDALGTVDWIEIPAEDESRRFRRSLFISCDVKAGEQVNATNVRSVRPAGGMLPKFLDSVYGLEFKANFKSGTPLTFDLLDQ